MAGVMHRVHLAYRGTPRPAGPAQHATCAADGNGPVTSSDGEMREEEVREEGGRERWREQRAVHTPPAA